MDMARTARAIGGLALATFMWALWLAAPSTAVESYPPPTVPCVVGVTVEASGRSWSCVDAAGTPTWVDLGHTKPPTRECTDGSVTRFNGYVWTCMVKDGAHIVVKTKPWRKPAEIAYAHTASPTRARMTISANVPMSGCRVTASNRALLRGQDARLSGRTSVRFIDTSGLAPGKYTLQVKCKDRLLDQSGDLMVQSGDSVLLRSDCLDAWHDTKYADVVPGYGRRMQPDAVAGTVSACRQLAPLKADEYETASREAYLRVAQIAEREVRRLSTERGIPICQAIDEAFKPVDALGRRASTPGAGPIAGYLPDGLFPVLYRQWTDGPFRLKNTAACGSAAGSSNQALRLYNTTWMGCPIPGSTYVSFDQEETYPRFDAAKCPSAVSPGDRPSASVCIVWGDKIGNDVVGGIGRVFLAQGELTNDSFDCEDRALHTGTYVNVRDSFMPPLP